MKLLLILLTLSGLAHAQFVPFPPTTPSGEVLSAKGDVLSHNGTNDVILPVGATNQFLIANPAAASGLEWVDFLTGSYVLANKDIDGSASAASDTNRVTLPSGTTAALDALTRKAGTVVYDTTLKKLKVDDGTNLNEVSGGGAGGINYITNTDAEGGTTGYVTYDDGAVSVPVDGTGGTSANLTFTQNTTTPLRGLADFLITKSANDAQGEGVSYDFTIDKADQAKSLVISIDYSTSANYADDDIKFFVYDVTNSNLIRVNGEDLKAINGESTHYARFQTAPDSTSYRLIAHVASTNASAYTVNLDNVQVGPKSLTYGTPITDWVSFTPTLTHTTNTTLVSAYRRRVGDTYEYDIEINYTGQPNNAAFAVSGLPIDSSKVANGNPIGTIRFAQNGVGLYQGAVVVSGSDAVATLPSADSDQSDNRHNPLTNVIQGIGTDVAISSGDELRLKFSHPASGLSANAQMSEDLGNRKIEGKVRLSGFQSIPNNTETTVIWNTVTTDTAGMYNSSNGELTAPQAGTIDLNASILFSTANWVANGFTSIQLFKNGTLVDRYTNYLEAARTGFRSISLATAIEVVRGDVLEIKVQHDEGAASDIGASVLNNWFTWSYRANPQTIFKSEKVFVSYQTDAGQTVSNNAIIDFEDKVKDTHNAVTTGASWVFTAPRAGTYLVNVGVRASTTTVAANQLFNTYFEVNSTEDSRTNTDYAFGTTTRAFSSNGSKSFELARGETISIKMGSTLTAATLESALGSRNYITIESTD